MPMLLGKLFKDNLKLTQMFGHNVKKNPKKPAVALSQP